MRVSMTRAHRVAGDSKFAFLRKTVEYRPQKIPTWSGAHSPRHPLVPPQSHPLRSMLPPPSPTDQGASHAPQPSRKTADLPAYRRAYWKDYKARQKRASVLLSPDEHERFSAAATSAAQSLPATIKTLALARLDEAPPGPNVSKTQVDEVIFLLRNLANNTNQIARRLNQEARDHRPTSTVEGETILTTLFAEWRELETRARATFPLPA